MSKFHKIAWMTGLAVFCLLPEFCSAQSANKNNPPTPVESESQVVSDNCYTLNDNEDWKRLFSLFSDAYQKKEYQQALSYMRDLQNICDRSPVLNFSIATTYREMGDNQEALKYYHKATGNTEFAVSPEMQQKFWYAQYEAENAEVMCEQANLDACEKEKTDLKARLETYQLYSGDDFKHSKVVMWTGAGIGIAGLILTATGAVLSSSDDSVKDISMNEDKSFNVKLKPKYVTGLTLLGVGIGATVAGAVMAGIGGYHYTHAMKDNVTASWNISPTNVEFGLTF